MEVFVTIVVLAAIIFGVWWNRRNAALAHAGVSFTLAHPPSVVAEAIDRTHNRGAKAVLRRGLLGGLSVSPLDPSSFATRSRLGDTGEISISATPGGSLVRARALSLYVGAPAWMLDNRGGFWGLGVAISHSIYKMLGIAVGAAKFKSWQNGLQTRIRPSLPSADLRPRLTAPTASGDGSGPKPIVVPRSATVGTSEVSTMASLPAVAAAPPDPTPTVRAEPPAPRSSTPALPEVAAESRQVLEGSRSAPGRITPLYAPPGARRLDDAPVTLTIGQSALLRRADVTPATMWLRVMRVGGENAVVSDLSVLSYDAYGNLVDLTCSEDGGSPGDGLRLVTGQVGGTPEKAAALRLRLEEITTAAAALVVCATSSSAEALDLTGALLAEVMDDDGRTLVQAEAPKCTSSAMMLVSLVRDDQGVWFLTALGQSSAGRTPKSLVGPARWALVA